MQLDFLKILSDGSQFFVIPSRLPGHLPGNHKVPQLGLSAAVVNFLGQETLLPLPQPPNWKIL